jgi:phosphoenolpyruvate-protein phosphotransferase/dihydroxyacetone kinase phosphotransfer subunit
MVGLVVVSHSRALALAAVALAEEMVHGQRLTIAVAAGLDELTFGTDAVAITEAIAAADDGDGVVVLMDLGSAVLSAELALDLMDDQDARDRVTLCPAPLVEGLVVAAVAAAGGAGRAEVAAEAAAALAGKQSQLEPDAGTSPAAPDSTAEAESELSATFTLSNPHGLHARPAARLVQQVRQFDAEVRLRNLTTGAGPVPAGSLSRVATLGALTGHQVEVSVTGTQARQALEGVLSLARRGFDEHVSPPAEGGLAPAVTPLTLTVGPLAASPGIAIGPAQPMRVRTIEVPDEPAGDPAEQGRRLSDALTVVRSQVEGQRVRAAAEVGASEVAIFDAHLMLLEDSALLGDARARLASQGAAPAWAAAVARAEAELGGLSDPYLRARAADVRAVGDQVLRALLPGDEQPGEDVVEVGVAGQDAASGVLVAGDLTPAQAAGLDPDRIAGVVLAFGSPTAHSAILARARGIPAVVAAGAGVLDIAPGTLLAVDGDLGELVVDPAPAVRATFEQRARDRAARASAALARSAAPAVTRDGVEVLVAANIGSAQDARDAAAAGADGAGLVRTEFLFLGRASAPEVDEQEKAYLAIAAALGGRRITLRTLDVGGDKPLDYVPMPAEANPFLGVRGLRLSLLRPQLLIDQLIAVLRVARQTPVSVMFPMVSTVAELVRARAMLDDAVRSEGGAWPSGLQVGIMIEVPAAALKARSFAPHVDFLSIGTNDLTQYTMAAERGNDATAGLGDPFDPAVLRLVQATCAGVGPGVLVAVCGELAADERATGLLLGLGVGELSMTPRAVPVVKEAVRAVELGAARDLAGRALQADGPDAVRSLLASA